MTTGSHFSGTPNANTYRADIDGLRAAAVLLVVFYHAGFAAFPGGFVGVDIFFVISGYLITGNHRPGVGRWAFHLRHFYARRIKRILPALFVVLAVSAIAALFILIPGELENLSAVPLFQPFSFIPIGYFIQK